MNTSQTTLTSAPDYFTNSTDNGMNTSQATVTFTPGNLTNTTDDDYNGTGTTNNTYTDIKPGGYPTFWMEILIPFGSLFVILVIFLAVYHLKLKKQNNGSRTRKSDIYGLDNVVFQTNTQDTNDNVNKHLEHYEEVTLPPPSEGRRSSTIQVEDHQEVDQGKKMLENYETIRLPKPTKHAKDD